MESRYSYTDNTFQNAENRILKHELQGGTIYGVSLEQFYKDAFGDLALTWDEALALAREAVSTPNIRSSIDAYLGPGSESSLYPPFEKMVNDVLEHHGRPIRCVRTDAKAQRSTNAQRKCVLRHSVAP